MLTRAARTMAWQRIEEDADIAVGPYGDRDRER